MRHSVGRRAFIAICLSFGFAVLLLAPGEWRRRIQRRLERSIGIAGAPPLPDQPVGELDPDVLRVLLSSVDALAGMPVEAEHYAVYFRFRARTLPGSKWLYEEFASRANHDARRAQGREFAELELPRRVETLEGMGCRGPAGGTGPIERLLRSEALRYRRYFVREVMTLFSGTEGWLSVGYDAWPGTPRGLDRYTQPLVPRKGPA